MIHIAIVDDDQGMLRELSKRVEMYLQERASLFQIFQYKSGLELLKSNGSFDLLFLDIQMKGLSGMETAKRLRVEGADSVIVFVTALGEYVYDAFEVEAAGYLLKPIEDERFRQMMDRVCGKLQDKDKNTLRIPSKGNTYKSVSFRDIHYCEAVNHQVAIHTSASVVHCYFKLDELANRLDERFFQCHRSYLVNLEAVCGYEGGLALLTNGERIPVSRLRGQEFSQAVLRHMKEGGC